MKWHSSIPRVQSGQRTSPRPLQMDNYNRFNNTLFIMHIFKNKKNSKGLYIYIIIHPKFDGWVKVGRTYDLKGRINTYQTGCPFREYSYAFTKLLTVDEVKKIEQYFKINIHNNGCEWYNTSIGEAINIINNINNT